MNKYLHILIAGLALCIAAGSNISAAPLEITVSSIPSLPLENLVKNGGFEEGMKNWTISGQPEKAEEQGWKVEISKDAYQGDAALHILAEKKAAGKTPGVWQTPGIFTAPSVAGKSYILSCMVKAGNGVTNVGGIYCGAGSSMSLYSSDWKRSVRLHARTSSTNNKWVRVISKPVEAEDWCKNVQLSAGLAYTAGEVWIDDIRVTEAYANLAINIKGNVRQVIVEDESGNILLDSGPLAESTTKYSKEVKAEAAHTYTIKALDKDGAVTKKNVVID
jgi:hypothetical protein